VNGKLTRLAPRRPGSLNLPETHESPARWRSVH
jgi:hypothetical protein